MQDIIYGDVDEYKDVNINVASDSIPNIRVHSPEKIIELMRYRVKGFDNHKKNMAIPVDVTLLFTFIMLLLMGMLSFLSILLSKATEGL